MVRGLFFISFSFLNYYWGYTLAYYSGIPASAIIKLLISNKPKYKFEASLLHKPSTRVNIFMVKSTSKLIKIRY